MKVDEEDGSHSGGRAMDLAQGQIARMYPGLAVLSNPSSSCASDSQQQQHSYLHIWQPVSQPSLNHGLRFLPCFHVIVTQQSTDLLNFNLLTFHGKPLGHQVVKASDLESGKSVFMLDSLSSGHFKLCQGFQEMTPEWNQEAKFVFKSPFLIESLGSDRIVLRSSTCHFAVTSDKSTSDTTVRCAECLLFENDSKDSIQKHESNGCDEKPVHSESKKLKGGSRKRRKHQQPTLEEEESSFFYQSVKIEDHLEIEMQEGDGDDDFDMDNGKDNSWFGYDVITNGTDAVSSSVKVKEATKSASGKRQRKRKLKLCLNDNYKCNFCLVQYRHQINVDSCLKKHERSENWNEPGSCPVCAQEFESRQLLVIEHYPQSHGQDGETYCCYECLQVVKIKDLTEHLTEHFLTVQSKKPDLHCKVCRHHYQWKFFLDKCMERHQEALDLQAEVTCPLCNETMGKLEFTDHFLAVHPSQMGCCECLAVMDDKEGALRKHIVKDHHAAGKSHLCPDCGQEYRSKARLEAHISKEHKKLADFVCQHCGAVFAHRDYYTNHMSMHDPRDLHCIHCDKAFNRRSQLVNHLLLHTKLMPYKCRECGYENGFKGNVSIHIKHMHRRQWTDADIVIDTELQAKMRKIAYAEANRIVATRGTAQVNSEGPTTDDKEMKREKESEDKNTILVHNPDNLQCLHCGKTFPRKKNLLQHLELHTKFKPYKCKECGFVCAKKCNVYHHIKAMHHRKWSSGDVITDTECEALMKKIAADQSNQVRKPAPLPPNQTNNGPVTADTQLNEVKMKFEENPDVTANG